MVGGSNPSGGAHTSHTDCMSTHTATIGHDLLNGSVANPRGVVRACEEALTHDTPSYAPDDIPRGRLVHTGNGVWMQRCHQCDDYVYCYGPLSYIHEMVTHEREQHGIERGAMLP